MLSAAFLPMLSWGFLKPEQKWCFFPSNLTKCAVLETESGSSQQHTDVTVLCVPLSKMHGFDPKEYLNHSNFLFLDGIACRALNIFKVLGSKGQPHSHKLLQGSSSPEKLLSPALLASHHFMRNYHLSVLLMYEYM